MFDLTAFFYFSIGHNVKFRSAFKIFRFTFKQNVKEAAFCGLPQETHVKTLVGKES